MIFHHRFAIVAIAASPFLFSGSVAQCLENAPSDATCLYNSNFTDGTLIIDSPGSYKLCEDIVFNPNAPVDGDQPSAESFGPDFAKYDPNAYGLGFFAAIAVATDDFSLYLDCKTIEQSPGHALFQRFFAVIELASSPFLPAVGPHNFVADPSDFVSASNVNILGPGTIGLSSHHGIHGNENKNVVIQDVHFKDFEVAAVSLNNVDDLIIKDNTVERNRHDVPVVGSFSAARQISAYCEALTTSNFSMEIKGEAVTAETACSNLITSINTVYSDVIETGFIKDEHTEEIKLFNNTFASIDGPCYAFVVHGKGPAVGGMGFALDEDDSIVSSNITIANNVIKDIKCWTNEIPAAVVEGVVQNDARGAILQFISSVDGTPLSIDSNGKYLRNVVADLQIMVAKAIIDGVLPEDNRLQTGTNTISSTIVDWASTDDVFTPLFRCNGDSMHHVSKGTIIIRVEDTKGFDIRGNIIEKIENLSPAPFGDSFGVCTDFHAGASVENPDEQQGGNVRVISVSAVDKLDNRGVTKSSTITDNAIMAVTSQNANAIIGIDIQGESRSIDIDGNAVDLSFGIGENIFDKFIALRFREFVDQSNGSHGVVIGDNEFAQEAQLLNRRRLGFNANKENILQKAHEHVPGFKNEWELGGCPFAGSRKNVASK